MYDVHSIGGDETRRSVSPRIGKVAHAPRRVRRASLALALSRLEREHVALLLAICELETAPNDVGEGAALRQALLPMLREDLRQTQHALALAARGAYGSCEECHKQLSARHLEITPAATLCPECAARARRGLQA